MEFDLYGYLEEKELNPRFATDSEIRAYCPFHDEDKDGLPGALYINNVEQHHPFKCFRCDESGTIQKLRRLFGDVDLVIDPKEEEANQLINQKIYASATDYCHEILMCNEDKLVYLTEERGLTAKTILDQKLGWNDGGLIEELKREFSEEQLKRSGLMGGNGYDIFANSIIIPYFRLGKVVQIRARMFSGNAKYKTPSGQPSELFNVDVILSDPEASVVVTEGEFDALILNQMGIPAVGVPGANSWKPAWGRMFDAATTYLWFDQDTAGKKGAKSISEDIKGVRVVEEAGREDYDITDHCVKVGRDYEWFMSILNSTKTKWVRSVQEAFDDWEAYDGNDSLDGIRLGYDIFDVNVETGFLASDLVVLLAATNAGKSIFLFNVAHNIRMQQPDKHILMISLEQTMGQWYERARRINRFYTMEQDPHQNNIDTVNFWKDNFMIVDVNRLGPEGIYECIDEYEMIMGVRPDMVFVDYLGYWARSFPGESYGATSAAVMKLKESAKEAKVTIFAPHQVNRGAKQGEIVSIDEARDSGVVGETADFAFSMWNPDAIKGNHGKVKSHVRKFKIDKSRRGPTGVEVDLQFDANSLTLVDNSNADIYRRAITENQLSAMPKYRTYEACFQELIAKERGTQHVQQYGSEEIPKM